MDRPSSCLYATYGTSIQTGERRGDRGRPKRALFFSPLTVPAASAACSFEVGTRLAQYAEKTGACSPTERSALRRGCKMERVEYLRW